MEKARMKVLSYGSHGKPSLAISMLATDAQEGVMSVLLFFDSVPPSSFAPGDLFRLTLADSSSVILSCWRPQDGEVWVEAAYTAGFFKLSADHETRLGKSEVVHCAALLNTTGGAVPLSYRVDPRFRRTFIEHYNR